MFGDLVSSLAFRHCSGVVDLPTGKKNELQLVHLASLAGVKGRWEGVGLKTGDDLSRTLTMQK